MTKVLITKTSFNQIVPHFKVSEFFSKCLDFNKSNHLLDYNLILAAETIRSFVDSPVFVTSSFRTKSCNTASGGAANSYHLLGRALDLKSPFHHFTITDDLLSQGPLFRALRKHGVGGFGLGSNFIHIDNRPSGSIAEPDGKSYDLWHY